MIRRSWILAPVLLLSGCVVHEARIDVPAAPPGSDGVTTLNQRVIAAGPACEDVRRSPLPIDVTMSTWWRDGDRVLWRDEQELETPQPWWQRFPCDIAADFTPVEFVSVGHGAVAPQRIAERSRESLDAEAEACGYRTPAKPR